MVKDNQEHSQYYILISSYESTPKNQQEYGTRENYNKFFMAYNLIHEIGHALSSEYYGSLPKLVKSHLDDEMLSNKLAAAFWKEFNARLFIEIQAVNQQLMEEVDQKCWISTDADDVVYEFFLCNCKVRRDNRLVYIDNDSHDQYQNYFQTYSIIKGGEETSCFQDICVSNFPITLDISGTSLPILDYNNDKSLITTICEFCKRIGFWIPLTIYILDDKGGGYNHYCKNFDKNYHLVRYEYTSDNNL
jgi:hypothetical protein